MEFILNDPAQLTIQRRGSGPSCIFTSQELERMNLKDGRNIAKIYFPDFKYTKHFNIYLYSQNKKLIITDIDGTITKEDYIGTLAKIFKFAYHHKGVVELFDEASKNGYIMIYLSAIPLAADELTRNYLFKKLQNVNGHSLPISPVIMSPLVWHTAIWKDYKKAMKLSALNSLLALFDLKETVVSGAYGNKDSDSQAYLKAGIADNRVFLVNPQSVMINVGTKEDTSYVDQVHQINSDKIYPRY